MLRREPPGFKADRNRPSNCIFSTGCRYRPKMLQRSPVQTGVGQQDEISPALGTGDRRGPSPERIFDIELETKPSRDFRITAAHRIGEGSLHEKARDNIAAIRLLKILEAEDREATLDEKSVLARYVGWGAMPNVFGYAPPDEWRSTAVAVKDLLTEEEY
jgi:hypothetical protein